MHMDEDHGEDRADGRDDRAGRRERIGVGGGDDAVTRIQLAARWSESFAPEDGDSLVGTLKRFRMAYEYLDAVIHGVEPVEPEIPEHNARSAQPAAPLLRMLRRRLISGSVTIGARYGTMPSRYWAPGNTAARRNCAASKPPNNSVPAIAHSGCQLANVTRPSAIQPRPPIRPSVHVWTIDSENSPPAKPISMPPMMTAAKRYASTWMPMESAVAGSSPIARRCRPRRVWNRTTYSSTARAYAT